MRVILGTAVCLALVGTPAFADPPPKTSSNNHQGQIELAGSTGVTFNRLTAGAGGSSSSINVMMVNGQILYYASEHLGVGALVNLVKLSAGGSGPTFTTFGGAVKYRIPLSDKANFYVGGSVGRFSIGSTGGTPTHSTFFGGGGGADLWIGSNAAFTLGVNFQHAKLGDTSISGLLVGFGFSVFLK